MPSEEKEKDEFTIPAAWSRWMADYFAYFKLEFVNTRIAKLGVAFQQKQVFILNFWSELF